MNKIIMKGICCQGCQKEIKKIFSDIYGIKNIVVSSEDCSVSFDGFVSKRVIEQAFKGTDYKVDKYLMESKIKAQ